MKLRSTPKNAGCGDRSIRRWMAEPAFRKAYLKARRATVELSTGSIQRLTARAAAALDRNLECGHPSSEIRAANSIMSTAHKAIEVLELEDRIAFLERNEALRAKHTGKRR